MLVAGFRRGLLRLHLRSRAPERWARRNPILYDFLSHKWYFDELYDVIFVKPAFWIGRLFWKRRRRHRHHRSLRPGRDLGPGRVDVTGRR